MNRPQMELDPNTGETLFDVFNEGGFVLLLGVSVADASRIMAERMAVRDPQWDGEVRVVMARRGPDVLRLQTSVECVRGRLEVHCQVDRLLPSGLTVAELFAKMHPELIAAAQEAAARAPDQASAHRPVSICVDVGEPDPSLILRVHDPVACLSDLDGHLGKLQRIVQSVIDANSRPTPSECGAEAAVSDLIGLAQRRDVGSTVLTCADGLPLGPRHDIAAGLSFTGTNLGLGGDEQPVVNVACGTWSASITVELALLHLDDFGDAHRARLVGVIGAHFGIQLLRGAA